MSSEKGFEKFVEGVLGEEMGDALDTDVMRALKNWHDFAVPHVDTPQIDPVEQKTIEQLLGGFGGTIIPDPNAKQVGGGILGQGQDGHIRLGKLKRAHEKLRPHHLRRPNHLQ